MGEDSLSHNPAKFKDYHIHNITYKVISGHNIDLSIVVPKSLVDAGIPTAKKAPVIAEFHGGALVSGARLHSPWVSNWLLELIQLKGAIMVSPDYRLLPEASGLDVLSDLASFWTWVSENLESTLGSLYPNLKPDFDKLILRGGSAGGYLVAQSMLLHPELSPKAAIMAYPMSDMRDDWWSKAGHKPVFGQPENFPVEIAEQHLKSLTPESIVTRDGVPDKKGSLARLPLALSLIQHGKYMDFFGDATELYPFENLPRVDKLPPFVWICHGKQDSLVPFVQSECFIEEIKKHHPDVNLRFDAHEGDHGFDNDSSINISSGWMKEGADELLEHW